MAIKVLIGTPALNGNNGVQTVTGDGVNNTDPQNPVLSYPTPNDIGATKKALTQELVNTTPKTIASTDSDKTFNVFGVGALCEFTLNTGALNVGEAFEVNIGDSDGVDVVAGAGVNVFGNITGSATVGDSLLVRRITDNSFGLTGEVYKVY